jgi:hypothetical protein
MVLRKKCKICDYKYDLMVFLQGTKCNSIYFQQHFESWTSGNDDIDKFIQNTQLSAHQYDVNKILEWIPYDRFYNIKYIERIGIYEANWIDGNIIEWDEYDQNWKRANNNLPVTLKSLNNPKNVLLEFKDQVLFKKIINLNFLLFY